MIHVKVTSSDGTVFKMPRRAWFISAVSNREGIIVYKNDPHKRFEVVDLNILSLDIWDKNKTEPVIDSLKDINLKLKGS